MSLSNSPSWSTLAAHYQIQRQYSLKQLFQVSPNRFQQFSLDVAGLFVDYSKNYIVPETIALLTALATERQLKDAISALFSGEKMNRTEARSALHTALRLPAEQSLIVDGANLNTSVQAQLYKMQRIAQQLEKKELKGYSEKPIDTILHVGMGGSGVGPVLYYQAMQSLENTAQKATCYFLTEFDYGAVQATLAHCNPETTIVVIVSKSFTTQETLTIFQTIKNWLQNAASSYSIEPHFYAVTAQKERAIAAGFLPHHILTVWDWVGGRFSIWSAVNFAGILAFGIAPFRAFLLGAHEMDIHFQEAPFKQNLPVIMALLSIWYINFYHLHSHAVVPYSAVLHSLPRYLQQLHMESLGKSVTTQGAKIDYATGSVIWGDTGPGSQHSFHQLLMQGSQIIPVDFILPLYHRALNEYDLKRSLYCLSQSQTLMMGHEVAHAAHQSIQGDCPSTTIVMHPFTPKSFGALIAMYEHSVFIKSVIWDMNAFDQWGVERGKQVADDLAFCLGNRQAIEVFDGSTRGLFERIVSAIEP